ncbi:MAG TPA: hypothetical protein VLV16_14770 [Gemmatimonadales bacterium]|nr:hypothetical protein [Gemmatimonadales bacterium]
MRPPDADDPAFAAFMKGAADSIEAEWRRRQIVVPPGVAIAMYRAMFAHMREFPLVSGTFYNISTERVLPLVQRLESELPGGHTNPSFSKTLESRLLEMMKTSRSQEQ